MSFLSTILSLLIGVAGWHYLFYSKAAQRLSAVEAEPDNLRRVRLRRVNGGVMIFLALLLYLGTHAIDPEKHPRSFLMAWSGAVLLLFAIVCLGVADMRLTIKLRRRKRGK